MALRIRKGDRVQVTAGADRGTQGKVIAVDPVRGRVRVEGVRKQKRHLKAGRREMRTGGIVEQEGFIDASNVMLLDPSTNQPTRVRLERRDDKRVRVAAKSGEVIPDAVG